MSWLDTIKSNRLGASVMTVADWGVRGLRHMREKPDGSFHGNDEVVSALRNDGFAVIPNYLSPEHCAELRKEIDTAILQRGPHIWRDPVESDHRLYGIERISERAQRYHFDPCLHALAEHYHQTHLVNAFSMGSKVIPQEFNRGSGQGWHRDSFDWQFISILYLNDVDNTNGPFQYLKHSHHLSEMLRFVWRSGLAYNQNRIDQEVIEDLLAIEPETLATVTGTVGTLVFFDPRGIHRGKPIQTEQRYSLTNHFMPRVAVKDSMLDVFEDLPFVDGKPLDLATLREWQPRAFSIET